jgi:hypothetical protein
VYLVDATAVTTGPGTSQIAETAVHLQKKMSDYELCPGCEVNLPRFDGPTHRYIGASPACWALFASLVNAGQPPLAPGSLNGLITDAYAAQHPGVPSPQAIQSVAVHLLTLYGVLVGGMSSSQALWIRQRALRPNRDAKHGRFHWLTPPAFHGSLTIADIVQEPTPSVRTGKAADYVTQVWQLWAARHLLTIAGWYDTYVTSDRS